MKTLRTITRDQSQWLKKKSFPIFVPYEQGILIGLSTPKGRVSKRWFAYIFRGIVNFSHVEDWLKATVIPAMNSNKLKDYKIMEVISFGDGVPSGIGVEIPSHLVFTQPTK